MNADRMRARRWLQPAWRLPRGRTEWIHLAQLVALRAWVTVVGCFPIEANLRTARLLGRFWWWLTYRVRGLARHRERAIEHLRFALQIEDAARLERIARASFEHLAQLYLVELWMTPRLVNEWTWSKYVELRDLGPALRRLLEQRGAIMLTGHFGNYELLGYVIARLGLPLTAVMRPLDNELVNEHLVRSRAAGGIRLLYKRGATAQAEQVLRDGGALCFIADQDAGRKGMFVEFFGRPASTYKSFGLLAMHFNTPIIVGQAVRTRAGFHYRMEVERIIDPDEWREQADPLRWITQEFSSALERAIRRHPEQYLWIHRRWKHQPPERRSREEPQTDDAS